VEEAGWTVEMKGQETTKDTKYHEGSG
jgi:hypothetical protein